VMAELREADDDSVLEQTTSERLDAGALVPWGHNQQISPSEILPGENDRDDNVGFAREQADRAVAALRAGTGAVIGACALIARGIDRFSGRREMEDAFSAGLLAGRLLTEEQASMGLEAAAKGSSKLCMLRKVGEHASLLLRADTLPLLEPGYSVLYHSTVLYGLLPGEEDAKGKEFVRILEGCPGRLSRGFLSEQIRALKRSSKAAKSKADGALQGRQSQDDPAEEQDGLATAEVDQKYDLMLLTPRRADFHQLGANYPDQGALARALNLHEQVADKAAAVILARLDDLPVIINVLLPACGFPARGSHLLLARRPQSPDVTSAEVIVVAERGMKQLNVLEDSKWFEDDEVIDPLAIADALVPAATNKLHAFASDEAPGWRSLIGDATWADKPSL
jgi:hypothetical protein